MIDISGHSLLLGVDWPSAPIWAKGVLVAGRDAAFVDTGYLRALLDESDGHHLRTKRHFDSNKVVLYTSALVVAELMRQFSKYPERNQLWRWDRVLMTKNLFIDEGRIVICSTPSEVVSQAIVELVECQQVVAGLDLCDMMSVVILDQLKHRRVFGYDRHLSVFGATIEPSVG